MLLQLMSLSEIEHSLGNIKMKNTKSTRTKTVINSASVLHTVLPLAPVPGQKNVEQL